MAVTIRRTSGWFENVKQIDPSTYFRTDSSRKSTVRGCWGIRQAALDPAVWHRMSGHGSHNFSLRCRNNSQVSRFVGPITLITVQ
jgi:hypothetical protein